MPVYPFGHYHFYNQLKKTEQITLAFHNDQPAAPKQGGGRREAVLNRPIMNLFRILVLFAFFLPLQAFSQEIEKVAFNARDTTNGYYLAVRPRSNAIKGAVVLITSFSTPEDLLPETKLHNVTYANDLLMVAVSMQEKLYADTAAVRRLNTVLNHVVTTYKVDTAKFVLAGYDYAGNIALRYTELTQAQPARFGVHPKAVMAVDSPVDLFELWQWCKRQAIRNSRNAGVAKFLTDLMTKEHGALEAGRERYQELTPVYLAEGEMGNEQYLKNVPVRLYYDVDLEWHLKERRNSLYDTNIPGGTELIRRLLDLGNDRAELVAAKKPGMGSNGLRTPYSLSIVDEVECIHWIKNTLGIFDPNTWIAPYHLPTPEGWEVERFPIPISFAPQIPYNGVEDVRFTPGWGDEKSEQYWSYAYLWWLEGEQKIDAATLEKYLTYYYEGLVGRNITGRKIPAAKVVPTAVKLKSMKAVPGDRGSYTGTITMLDYMAQKPITLNCRVGVSSCKDQNHTAVFIELSPQPYAHPVWQDMGKIKKGFTCED